MMLFCRYECKSWALYEYTGKNMSDSCKQPILEIYDKTVIFRNTSHAELEFLRSEVIGGFVEASCKVLVDLCCAERPSLSWRRSRKSTLQPSPGVDKLSQQTRSCSEFSIDALVPLPILWFPVDFGWRRCDLRKYFRLYCSRSIKEKSWKKDKQTVDFVGVITLARNFKLWMASNGQIIIIIC